MMQVSRLSPFQQVRQVENERQTVARAGCLSAFTEVRGQRLEVSSQVVDLTDLRPLTSDLYYYEHRHHGLSDLWRQRHRRLGVGQRVGAARAHGALHRVGFADTSDRVERARAFPRSRDDVLSAL